MSSFIKQSLRSLWDLAKIVQESGESVEKYKVRFRIERFNYMIMMTEKTMLD